MRAAFLHKAGDVRIETVADPSPGEGEVLVRVRSVGVCGSDVHYYAHGRIGEFVVRAPQILGHEAAGELAKVGHGVEELKEGDRVAIEPGIPCERCETCREGLYNLCPDVQFLGTPPVQGAYREYLSYPAKWCHRLPEGMSFDEGAMIEPLAIGVFALDEAPIRAGESAAVFGCGPIGLVILEAAHAAGAGRVYVSEPIDARRRKALALGATATFDPQEKDPVEAILAATGGRGVDLAVEAAGAPDTYGQAVSVTRRNGTTLFVGIPEEDEVAIPAHKARRYAITIKNLRRFRGTYDRAIDLVQRGKADVASLVTHRFPLEEIDKAFRLVQGHEDGVIRAMIEV
ncbi:MAG: NAD(P)-dependent alcohol dehydrogenase [Planctomycetota bacterium]